MAQRIYCRVQVLWVLDVELLETGNVFIECRPYVWVWLESRAQVWDFLLRLWGSGIGG